MGWIGIMSLPTSIQVIGGLVGKSGSVGAGNTIPAGTFYGPQSSTGECADGTTISYEPDGTPTSASAGLRFVFSRASISGSSGFKITVENAGSQNATWYNTSLVGSVLTSAVTMYENNNVTPTEIKMNWSAVSGGNVGNNSASTSGAYVEDTWTATGSDGVSIQKDFDSSASAGSGAYSLNQTFWTVEFWGKATGYDDTLLATLAIMTEAEAESAF